MAEQAEQQNQKNRKKRVNTPHSREVRERYARGERYSPEASAEMRRNNYLRWEAKAKSVHGNKFDYVNS